jgi:hypothetical protein
MNITAFKQLKWKLNNEKHRALMHAEFILWKLRGGHVCVDCSQKTVFKAPIYEGKVNGKRMLLENAVNYGFGKSICNHCLAKRITKFFNTAGSEVKSGECDWLGEKTAVVTGIRGWSYEPHSAASKLNLFVMLGSNYWNGNNASRDAILELLVSTGNMRTSIFVDTGSYPPTIFCDGLVKHVAVPVSTK